MRRVAARKRFRLLDPRARLLPGRDVLLRQEGGREHEARRDRRRLELEGPSGRTTIAPVPGSEFEIRADLVLLAMGFVGPEKSRLLSDLGVQLNERGNVARDANWMTNVRGVFTAGDMQRGQSLIVWAIAEGRSAAHAIDAYLMGASQLPAPLP